MTADGVSAAGQVCVGTAGHLLSGRLALGLPFSAVIADHRQAAVAMPHRPVIAASVETEGAERPGKSPASPAEPCRRAVPDHLGRPQIL